eukprot:360857-Chlamydomonas_euryale.AAC.2
MDPIQPKILSVPTNPKHPIKPAGPKTLVCPNDPIWVPYNRLPLSIPSPAVRPAERGGHASSTFCAGPGAGRSVGKLGLRPTPDGRPSEPKLHRRLPVRLKKYFGHPQVFI